MKKEILTKDAIIEGENFIMLKDGTMITYLTGAVYTGNLKEIEFPKSYINEKISVVINGNYDSNIEITNIYATSIYVNAISKSNQSTCNFLLIAIGKYK